MDADTLTQESGPGWRELIESLHEQIQAGREREAVLLRLLEMDRQAPPQVLTWDEVSTITQELAADPASEGRTVKLTLIGRPPARIETRGQAVVFRMQGKPPASVPRGLPPLPSTPGIVWNVMVALRQWNRVKDSLASNQDDQLIIEGYPLMQGTEHVLLAQSCVSMLQQRAQKQAQQQPQTETTA